MQPTQAPLEAYAEVMQELCRSYAEVAHFANCVAMCRQIRSIGFEACKIGGGGGKLPDMVSVWRPAVHEQASRCLPAAHGRLSCHSSLVDDVHF